MDSHILLSVPIIYDIAMRMLQTVLFAVGLLCLCVYFTRRICIVDWECCIFVT